MIRTSVVITGTNGGISMWLINLTQVLLKIQNGHRWNYYDHIALLDQSNININMYDHMLTSSFSSSDDTKDENGKCQEEKFD